MRVYLAFEPGLERAQTAPLHDDARRGLKTCVGHGSHSAAKKRLKTSFIASAGISARPARPWPGARTARARAQIASQGPRHTRQQTRDKHATNTRGGTKKAPPKKIKVQVTGLPKIESRLR